MNRCAQELIDKLNEKELSFSVKEQNDEIIIVFPYSGINIIVAFDDKPDDNHMRIWARIENAPEEKSAQAIVLCNQLNSTYRFMKFYMDSDNDVIARADAVLGGLESAEASFELLARCASIIKETRPEIMKMIFS